MLLNKSVSSHRSASELAAAYAALKSENPRLYAFDAAKMLGCSEAELVALGCPEQALRLSIPDMTRFLNELTQFGPAMFLARNEAAVLEADALPVFADKVKLIEGRADGFYLALSVNAWSSAFAVLSSAWLKRGIQFFNTTGTAVLKIYIRDNARAADFDIWIRSWLSAEQTPEQPVWNSGNTECRARGVRDAAEESVDKCSYSTLLNEAVASGEKVRLSLCNSGCCLETHAAVKTVRAMPPWFNILDEAIHVHLREELVTGACVRASALHTDELSVSFEDAAGMSVFRIGIARDGKAAKTVFGESAV